MASPWACEWDRWVGGGEGGEQIRGFYNFQQGTNLPNYTTGEFQKPVLYFLLTQKGQVTVPELGTYHIFVQRVKALCCACYPRRRCFFITFLHASSPFCITLHYFSKTGDQRQETGHGRWKRRTGHGKWERGQVMGDGRGGQDTVYGRGGQKMGDWRLKTRRGRSRDRRGEAEEGIKEMGDKIHDVGVEGWGVGTRGIPHLFFIWIFAFSSLTHWCQGWRGCPALLSTAQAH